MVIIHSSKLARWLKLPLKSVAEAQESSLRIKPLVVILLEGIYVSFIYLWAELLEPKRSSPCEEPVAIWLVCSLHIQDP